MDRRWNELPGDLLTCISQRLDSAVDLLRFRSTCKSWRDSSITLQHYSWRHRMDEELRKLPYLFVDYSTANEYLYSNVELADHPYYFQMTTWYAVKPNSHTSIYDEDDDCWYKKPFVASSKESFAGKMVPLVFHPDFDFLEGIIPRFKLEANMLDLSLVQLCRTYTAWKKSCKTFGAKSPVYFGKVAMIRGKSSDDQKYVVGRLCEHLGHLAILNSEDKRWTVTDDWRGFHDIIGRFNDRLIYAVDSTGRLVKVDLSSKVTQVVAGSGNIPEGGMQKYLVESSGDLLLLDRYVNVIEYGDNFGRSTETESYFRIYKLNEGRGEWIEIRSLGEQVIVLDRLGSFSAAHQDLGLSHGNRIYYETDCGMATHISFTHRQRYFFRGVAAVFNLNDG